MLGSRITVGAVSWWSGPFLARLFESIRETVLDSEVEFLVCDNTNGLDQDLVKALHGTCTIIPCQPIVPREFGFRRYRGSPEHGYGLNLLIQKATTEYMLLVDPDCLLLAKGWDVVCREALYQHVAVGAPYHSTKISKYHGFPSPVFSFFRPATYRAMGADFGCCKLPIHNDIWDQLRRIVAIMGGRLGERVRGRAFYASRLAAWMRVVLGNSSKDTGWRVAAKAKAEGYSAQVFAPIVAAGQLAPPFSRHPSVRELMNEFELFAWQGVPLLTHLYGSAHRRDSHESVRRWQRLALDVMNERCSSDLRVLACASGSRFPGSAAAAK